MKSKSDHYYLLQQTFKCLCVLGLWGEAVDITIYCNNPGNKHSLKQAWHYLVGRKYLAFVFGRLSLLLNGYATLGRSLDLAETRLLPSVSK
jgi:hypothetical protein